MKTIGKGSKGAPVEDIQQRLHLVGFLDEGDVDGVFGERTVDAVRSFCQKHNCGPANEAAEAGEVDDKVWAALVDATYNLGDRKSVV